MKRTILTLLSAVLLLVTGCSKSPQRPTNDLFPVADSLINAAIADTLIPGAVLCVVQGDRIIHLQAYGNRQVYPTCEPMTVETVFDLASLSKVVGTGMTAMSLVDEGLLDLQAPVRQYLPEYEGDATITDLMTHVSGLPAYAQWKTLLNTSSNVGWKSQSAFGSEKGRLAGSQADRDRDQQGGGVSFTPAEKRQILLRHVCHCPRHSEPRTDFCYSCLNFITLQYVMETITGRPLDQLASERVFLPLGMKHTGYCVGPLPEVAPTELQPDSTCLKGVVHDPLARVMNSGVSGNAGVFSTAEDLARMAMWVMRNGSMESKGSKDSSDPFSAETLHTMVTIPEGYEAFGRALAWDVSSDYNSCLGTSPSPTAVCHTGYTGTSMMIDLEHRYAIILLTNRVHPYDKGGVISLRRAVADAIKEAL